MTRRVGDRHRAANSSAIPSASLSSVSTSQLPGAAVGAPSGDAGLCTHAVSKIFRVSGSGTARLSTRRR
jgi:hypothetical protein